jgi:hypothetical protein
LFALLALLPATVQAQAPRTAILPDTIHVGDVITAAIRFTVPRDAKVAMPDSLTLQPDLENAGARVIKADTTPQGIQITAEYPIAGWRPGAYALPVIPYTVNGAAYAATFDSLRIASVLPADTTGVQPKPLKSVLGGDRVWWPWLLLLLLLLAAALAYWWWRRRGRNDVETPVIPMRPAREIAIERLEHARASGMVERLEMREFYGETSDALREYIAAIDPEMSTDLTTSEVAAVVRRRGADATGVELLTLLGAADLVKFARRLPRTAEAYEEWSRVRKWVDEAVWPPSVATEVAQEAA